MRQWVGEGQGECIFRDMHYDESATSVNGIGELEWIKIEDIWTSESDIIRLFDCNLVIVSKINMGYSFLLC